MKLKSCLQLDDSGGDPNFNLNPSLCLYLPVCNAILYAEGNFLLLNNLADQVEVEDGPVFGFQSEIEIIRFVKGDYILVSLKDDNDLAIINISKELKNFKLINKISLNSITTSKIIQIRSDQNGKVHLLTADSSLLIIENFVLFTRLNEKVLNERFLDNQVIKKYTLNTQAQAQAPDSDKEMEIVKILDFEFIPESDEILSVGTDYMITWWKFEEISSQPSSPISSSILSIFSVFKYPPVNESSNNSNPKTTITNQNSAETKTKSLTVSRILNEPDRTINRILCKFDNFVLLEDSKHGRLLVLDSDLGLIIKIFKGYRNCSAVLNKNKNGRYELLLWAGNRFTLEKFEKFPFSEQDDLNLLKIDDTENYYGCTAAFDHSTSTSAIFIYSPESFQLKFYI